jgi:hypothetical protein
MTRRVSTLGETRVRTGDCATGFMTNANLRRPFRTVRLWVIHEDKRMSCLGATGVRIPRLPERNAQSNKHLKNRSKERIH